MKIEMGVNLDGIGPVSSQKTYPGDISSVTREVRKAGMKVRFWVDLSKLRIRGLNPKVQPLSSKGHWVLASPPNLVL